MPVMSADLTPERLAEIAGELHNKGVVVLRNVLSEDERERLRAGVKSFEHRLSDISTEPSIRDGRFVTDVPPPLDAVPWFKSLEAQSK